MKLLEIVVQEDGQPYPLVETQTKTDGDSLVFLLLFGLQELHAAIAVECDAELADEYVEALVKEMRQLLALLGENDSFVFSLDEMEASVSFIIT